jgi:putative Mn2+ efflux pump MntP
MPLFHHVLAYLGIALAVSFDGLGVGAAYGAKRLSVPGPSLAYISVLTGALMSVSMKMGGLLSGFVSPEAARFWGGVTIVALGVWQGWQGYLEVLDEKLRSRAGHAYAWIPGPDRRIRGPGPGDERILSFRVRPLGIMIHILREPLSADQDSSGVIDSRESVLLGLALGLDAFAAGFGASLSGFSWLIVPLVAAACPAFLMLGCHLGRAFRANGTLRKCYALPGATLVTIGLLKVTGRF